MIVLWLVLGIILGLLIALIFLVTTVYLKERRIEIIEKVIERTPKEKGMILEPLSLREEVQQQIIQDNAEQGKDTLLKDLE